MIATSGSDRHPVLVPVAPAFSTAPTAAPTDAAATAVPPATAAPAEADEPAALPSVPGTVFRITAAELLAADEYEVDDYERVLVPLDTGEQAWVYVFRAS